jgi:hypothetical protein
MNIKTVIDGITFDSKREAEYYCELKMRKRSGDIKEFALQPKYLIIDGYVRDGKKVRPTYYIADFLIHHKDDSHEVVDVKGMETAVFKLKRKLFESKYNMKLTIVK